MGAVYSPLKKQNPCTLPEGERSRVRPPPRVAWRVSSPAFPPLPPCLPTTSPSSPSTYPLTPTEPRSPRPCSVAPQPTRSHHTDSRPLRLLENRALLWWCHLIGQSNQGLRSSRTCAWQSRCFVCRCTACPECPEINRTFVENGSSKNLQIG